MYQLRIENCHAQEVGFLNETLEETGALAITLTDRFDEPIFEPPLGDMPLWPHVVVEALYTDLVSAESAQNIVKRHAPHLQQIIQEIPEQDWTRVCLENIQPQSFGEHFWVCPSWIEPPNPNAVNLILDPGLAFGTGTHPTTALCLTWLAHHALTGYHVVDFGCGSGILAIAALLLGASSAEAIDIDEQALIATQSNATINHISSHQLRIHKDPSQQPADLILANILHQPLITLKETFQSMLKSSGQLVVSGLLKSQMSSLAKHYEDVFELDVTQEMEDWGLMVFIKK